MVDETAQDPRAMLEEAVEGANDEDLTRLAENLGGVEAFLDVTFQGMTEALDPDRAQDCVVGWEIVDGDDVHPYVVTISEGGNVVEADRGEPDNARVTLRLSLPNYLRLITGKLDGMQAFMSGALQLKGDMMFATQLQQMFGI